METKNTRSFGVPPGTGLGNTVLIRCVAQRIVEMSVYDFSL